MKNSIAFGIALLLLHITIYNPTPDWLLSFQFLAQGSSFDPVTNEWHYPIYSTLFNTVMVIMFISMPCKRISDTFEMHSYIFSRGGLVALKRTLINQALSAILYILCVKLVMYLIAFMVIQRFTIFFVYDLISVFLTLSMFSLIFIIAKLSGINNKIPLICMTAGHVVMLLLSRQFEFFSILTISSVNWRENFWFILPIKLLIVLLLMYHLIRKQYNQLIGVKEND